MDARMDFIRLLFVDSDEEGIAFCWATRFAALVGAKALQLRPETTLDEMLLWAADARVDSMDFVVVFEPELRMDLLDFLDHSTSTAFRDMVEHYASSGKSGLGNRQSVPIL